MAGLQYNFFPTDFVYPRSAKPGNSVDNTAAAAAAAVDKSSLPLQQYYFFPTDFLYPRSQPLQLQVNKQKKQRAAPIQIKKRGFSDNLEFPEGNYNPGVSMDRDE